VRKLRRILLGAIIVLVVALAMGITFTIGWRPFIGPRARALTSQKFEATPQRLERGRYLSNAVSGCSFCHSEHDWSKPDRPIPPGREGVGEVMPFVGLPGRIVAPNLTSDTQTGAGTWTDDQLGRAIREGIGHDGRALFPLMAYERFRHISDEDLASVVVYLRSWPPVRNELPKTEIIFPVKYLIRSVPERLTGPVVRPDTSDRVVWGRYMVTIGGCEDCHTPQDAHGQGIAGMNFAGGSVFEEPGDKAAATNITPDPTGLSYYDEALFLKAIHTGYVGARKLSPVMPYAFYGNMTDDDLKAIFAYLRTVKPVNHRVDNSLPPSYCKLCRQKHGAGDQN
jgi:mono/diheme cytochrome c family protein